VHGESPIVVGGESSVSVSKVVVSGPYGHEALRRSNSEGRNLGPDVSSSTACSLVVLCSLNSSFVSTKPSSLDVLGVAGIEGAPGLVRSQDGNISPWGRSPIWIVISLFGAFISVSVSVVVLSSVDGGVSVESSNTLSVSNKETLVSFSGVAGVKVDSVLVHSILKHTIGVQSGRSSSGIWNSVGGSTVTNSNGRIIIRVAAHVLDDKVAPDFGINSTTVLVSPFNLQKGTLIERHGGAIAVTSLGVILGVVQSIGIVSV